jgi:hypothetical protein
MKLFFGKLRLRIIFAVSKVLCVPIKVREEYLEEHVFGMKPSRTAVKWIDKHGAQNN